MFAEITRESKVGKQYYKRAIDCIMAWYTKKESLKKIIPVKDVGIIETGGWLWVHQELNNRLGKGKIKITIERDFTQYEKYFVNWYNVCVERL